MKRSIQTARLLVGLIGIFLGALLLLVTNDVIRAGELLVPIVMFLPGGALLWIGFNPEGRDGAVFPGAFLVLLAVFLILRATVIPEMALRRIWPVFLTMAGIALALYAVNSTSERRLVIGVPAFFIIGLSIIFLLFSLEIVNRSFIAFVLDWWPALLIFGGIVAIWSYRIRHSEEDDSSSSQGSSS